MAGSSSLSLGEVLETAAAGKPQKIAVVDGPQRKTYAELNALAVGVIAVWINPLYRRNEAEFILNNSQSRGVFIFSQWNGRDYLDDMLPLRKKLSYLDSVIVVGNTEGEGVTASKICSIKEPAKRSVRSK